ncbi:MAG: helix-turn-helix domain-containing protein, partial [Oligoflexales bacterium]
MASIAQVATESVRRWVRDFLLRRMKCFVFRKSPGRPRKLSHSMRRQLADILENSPEEQGYLTACWTCALVQDLIKKKFGIL